MRQNETFVALLTAVGRVGADADEPRQSSAVLADSVRALRVRAQQRPRLTSGLHSAHLLLVGEPRQVFDVAAVDAHAPDAADEKPAIPRPQVPRKSVRVVHCPDE